MEVILLEDIRTLGKKGDVVKVSDGYGRNLISKKQCLAATAQNKNDLKLKKQNEEKLAQKKYEEALGLGERLNKSSVTVSIKVGEGGKAFGAVSSKEIAKAVETQLKLDVDKKKIQLSESLKTLGAHKVQVKLHPKVTAELTVQVVKE